MRDNEKEKFYREKTINISCDWRDRHISKKEYLFSRLIQAPFMGGIGHYLSPEGKGGGIFVVARNNFMIPPWNILMITLPPSPHWQLIGGQLVPIVPPPQSSYSVGDDSPAPLLFHWKPCDSPKTLPSPPPPPTIDTHWSPSSLLHTIT